MQDKLDMRGKRPARRLKLLEGASFKEEGQIDR